MSNPTTYKASSNKIAKIVDLDGIRAMANTLTRLYDAQCLTESEFGRLDIKLVDKAITIEDGSK